ncbi:uL15 family ribosomal protein [Candidatus Micrarchaeota archaeon]|nr:uL15 family ribosomal protein [Candidatus Micrarchaeota archaeon]
MKRFRKRSRKLIGNRTHGRGESKRTRGKGNRGGVGHSGLKHKKTYRFKYEKHLLGKHGFVRPVRKFVKTINVYEIENLCRRGLIDKSDGVYVFEFDGKVLGTGSIHVPVKVRALTVTEKAKEKIVKAGGAVELLSEASGTESGTETAEGAVTEPSDNEKPD